MNNKKNNIELEETFVHRIKAIGNLQMDTQTLAAYIDDQDVKLTPLEFKLLQFFCETGGQMFSRKELLFYVWGETHVLKRTVDSTIAGLRKKTRSWNFKIRSVYGVGYKLDKRAA